MKGQTMVLRTKDIVNQDVENPQGENLGKIEDIMLDLNTGRVVYAVLSFGGFLGMGDKLFAIPWSIIKQNIDRDKFVIDVPKEMLKNAPGFDKNNWPNTSDLTWQERVYSHYEVAPYWTR